MRHRHLRQTCASLYHHRSSRQSHRISPSSSSSKGRGRQRWNILRSESSLRMWINVRGGLLTLSRDYSPVHHTHSRRTNVPLELGLTTTAPERRNRHVNVLSVQAVRGSALFAIWSKITERTSPSGTHG